MTSWCGSARPTSRDGRWAWIPNATSLWRQPAIRACVPAFGASAIGCSPSISGWTSRRVSSALERAGSLRSLIDSRQTADRTLTPIEPVTRSGGRAIGDAARHARSRRAHRVRCDGGTARAGRRRHRRRQSASTLDPARDRAPRRDRVVTGDQRAAGISSRPRHAGRNVEPAFGAVDRHQRVSDRRPAARAAGIADHCRRRGVRWPAWCDRRRDRLAGAGGDGLRGRPGDRRSRRGAVDQPAIVSIGQATRRARRRSA